MKWSWSCGALCIVLPIFLLLCGWQNEFVFRCTTNGVTVTKTTKQKTEYISPECLTGGPRDWLHWGQTSRVDCKNESLSWLLTNLSLYLVYFGPIIHFIPRHHFAFKIPNVYISQVHSPVPKQEVAGVLKPHMVSKSRIWLWSLLWLI